MALDAVFRDQWGRVLATLTGIPVGWLVTTARNRAIDQLRRRQVLAAKTTLLARDLAPGPPSPEDLVDDAAAIPDERLELIFTCCHPALAPEAQVALTLRSLGGLSTDEIALAFLVPFETMSKRLTRAKHKIRDARIPFAVPPGHQLPERLAGVCVGHVRFEPPVGSKADEDLRALVVGVHADVSFAQCRHPGTGPHGKCALQKVLEFEFVARRRRTRADPQREAVRGAQFVKGRDGNHRNDPAAAVAGAEQLVELRVEFCFLRRVGDRLDVVDERERLMRLSLPAHPFYLADVGDERAGCHGEPHLQTPTTSLSC